MKEGNSLMSENDEMRMPIKLTIVGNGFDLAIGAKTSYGDFYECLKECFNAPNLEEFKNHYVFGDNEQLIDSFFDIVLNNKDNYFINYFLNFERVFGNWVAFEKELTRIISSFDSLITALTSNKLYMDLTRGSGVDLYVRIIDKTDLLQVLNVYPNNKFFQVNLRVQDFKTVDKDAAVPITLKGKSFSTIYEVYKGISDFSDSFPLLLYNDLTVFSNLFSVYLGIVDHFANFDHIIQDAFDSSFFINYNFTNYLERIMKENGLASETVLYINGLAENLNGKAKEKIVFGIDSDTKLLNIGFEVFTKRIQRSIKDTDVSHLDFILKNNYEDVFIIGHSLNLADYESLNYILTRCENGIKPKITIYFYDEVARINLIINLKTILGNEKFDEYQREGMLELIESKRAWIKFK